jgi:hypothetical protein
MKLLSKILLSSALLFSPCFISADEIQSIQEKAAVEYVQVGDTELVVDQKMMDLWESVIQRLYDQGVYSADSEKHQFSIQYQGHELDLILVLDQNNYQVRIYDRHDEILEASEQHMVELELDYDLEFAYVVSKNFTEKEVLGLIKALNVIFEEDVLMAREHPFVKATSENSFAQDESFINQNLVGVFVDGMAHYEKLGMENLEPEVYNTAVKFIKTVKVNDLIADLNAIKNIPAASQLSKKLSDYLKASGLKGTLVTIGDLAKSLKEMAEKNPAKQKIWLDFYDEMIVNKNGITFELASTSLKEKKFSKELLKLLGTHVVYDFVEKYSSLEEYVFIYGMLAFYTKDEELMQLADEYEDLLSNFPNNYDDVNNAICQFTTDNVPDDYVGLATVKYGHSLDGFNNALINTMKNKGYLPTRHYNGQQFVAIVDELNNFLKGDKLPKIDLASDDMDDVLDKCYGPMETYLAMMKAYKKNGTQKLAPGALYAMFVESKNMVIDCDEFELVQD